jgi:hypothetical protein
MDVIQLDSLTREKTIRDGWMDDSTEIWMDGWMDSERRLRRE